MKQVVKIGNKQTVCMEVPDDYRAVYDEKSDTVQIVKLTLPKTWEEFCEITPIIDWEYFINERSEIDEVRKRERNPLTDKSTIQTQEMAVAFRALMQLIQLRDCYRQGWIPDWTNSGELKYSVVSYLNGVSTDVRYTTKGVLSFQTEELCNEFFANFQDLIIQAAPLI